MLWPVHAYKRKHLRKQLPFNHNTMSIFIFPFIHSILYPRKKAQPLSLLAGFIPKVWNWLLCKIGIKYVLIYFVSPCLHLVPFGWENIGELRCLLQGTFYLQRCRLIRWQESRCMSYESTVDYRSHSDLCGDQAISDMLIKNLPMTAWLGQCHILKNATSSYISISYIAQFCVLSFSLSCTAQTKRSAMVPKLPQAYSHNQENILGKSKRTTKRKR